MEGTLETEGPSEGIVNNYQNDDISSEFESVAVLIQFWNKIRVEHFAMIKLLTNRYFLTQSNREALKLRSREMKIAINV